MTAFDRDASIERRQIHEISLNVTRRLRKVLDRNRYIPASLTGEVDQTVQVITGIQRDVDQIMNALPADEALDFAILTHIMGGQRHALDLLEILEGKLDGGQNAYRRDSARVHQALLAVSREIEQDALRYTTEQPMPASELPRVFAASTPGPRAAPQRNTPRTAPPTTRGQQAPRPQEGQPRPARNHIRESRAHIDAALTTVRSLATKPVPVALTALLLGAGLVVVMQKIIEPKSPSIEIANVDPSPGRSSPSPAQSSASETATNVAVNPQPAPMEQPYLVVLATRRSTEELQQDYRGFKDSYPELLSTARARVDRVQGQDKETWYRLSLIPPQSHEDAKTLCSKLRNAGLSGCWIKSVPLH
jgi:hypothetical protein